MQTGRDSHGAGFSLADGADSSRLGERGRHLFLVLDGQGSATRQPAEASHKSLPEGPEKN